MVSKYYDDDERADQINGSEEKGIVDATCGAHFAIISSLGLLMIMFLCVSCYQITTWKGETVMSRKQKMKNWGLMC